MEKSLVPARRIGRAILIVGGYRVILDADLASMYGVTTRALVQAVKRNRRRFPKDFVVEFTKEDLAIFRSQSVIVVFQAIRELMGPPPGSRKRIGLRTSKRRPSSSL